MSKNELNADAVDANFIDCNILLEFACKHFLLVNILTFYLLETFNFSDLSYILLIFCLMYLVYIMFIHLYNG